jgi:hypothetical protein
MASWAHRTVLAGLLLAAYLLAWTPARTAWTRAAEILLDGSAPASARVSARPAAHTVHLQPANAGGITYRAPAGVKFLLPGLFLILIAPTRPWLGIFFAGHLALGGLALVILSVAAAGSLPGGPTLARFVQAYGVDAYSLAVPVLLFAARHPTRRLLTSS